MQQIDDALVLSASDLNNYLACHHLTELDIGRARGEIDIELEAGADADLLAKKGDEHEARYLESLRESGKSIVEIPNPVDGSLAALRATVEATNEALRAGPDVIYQATFLQNNLRGHADFLFRVDDSPSDLGDFSYEVADTKLARRAKPYFIVQLCFYSELLAAVQGREPESIHVVLGTNEQRSFRLAEFSAYFRHVRDRFLDEIDQRPATYPIPVEHCQVCRYRANCDARRTEDDHLSLVAGIMRRQYELLEPAGIKTLEALATDGHSPIPGLRAEQLAKLHDQAALQLGQRQTGEPDLRLLPYEERRGFARLPRPSEGDVFFDMEGDPFFDDGGLEYLFGFTTSDTGEPVFEKFWGRDRGEEKRAFEQFIDFVTERRERWPDLHVYHYAHYEVTALKRLAGQHGTREEELDQLLRCEVFVDLYKVVREGMRISQPSYSIKKVEAFYMAERDTAVTDGGDSIVWFEQWLENPEDTDLLDKIALYNRDDCDSTLLLRDWLLGLRPGVEESAGREIPWFEHEPAELGEATLARLEMNEPLMESLLAGVPDDPQEGDEEQKARWLMAQLLEYHHREKRPVWWAYFNRQTVDPDELIDDGDCIGGLEPVPETEERMIKRSRLFRMSFPVQETKLGSSRQVCDVADGGNPGQIHEINVEEGWLDLLRGTKLQKKPFPKALMPGKPIRTDAQEDALRRLAHTVLEGGEGYAAAQQILRRVAPRLSDREPGEPIDHAGMEVDELGEVVAALDDSYLFIQGPPGSGKTWSGARVIVDLIDRGKRVGVTSTSHKVIHNLLAEVEDVAAETGVSFRGLKKCSDDNEESEFDSEHGLIDSTSSVPEMNEGGVALTAGTAWHFCRDGTTPVDYLFIDEAGQISLADALALATAAWNVVLLGDPQQLPQVAQAAHPAGSSLSVLEHLLGDSQTVDERSGVFLEKTWRLHPEVCEFVSELMYDGRLGSAPGRERQRVDAKGELTGTGLRFMEVEHEGNSQSSSEEAERIAEAIEPLLDGATYTDCEGDEHPLGAEDILVVTPYNAQVKCLEQRLPAGVRIGTVDKFQGQQAQVVFFSMATSSQDEIPRNVEFLFSRNRLNVAVSRARCLAVLVASPQLLDISARSIEQMRLVGALCRFVELAATAGADDH